MFAESGYNTGMNEAAPIVPGSRGGYGLNQWTGPRRRAIEAEAERLGVPVSDLEFQLDYTMQELQGPERRAYDALMGTSSPTDAARIYSEQFLRPGIPHMDRRLGEAARLAGIEYSPGVLDMATRSNQQPMANQGILAALTGQQAPQQQQQAQGGGMWSRAPLGLSDPDRRARLAIALEGMTLNPNQALMQNLGQGIEQRREDQQTTAARSATSEWLRSQGRDDLAQLVEAGGLQGSQAMGLAMEEAQRRAAAGAPSAAIRDAQANADLLGLQGDERTAYFRRALGVDPESPDPTDDMREYNLAVQQGFTGTFPAYIDARSAARRPQTNVNVGAGETAFERQSGEQAATRFGGLVDAGVSAGRGLAQIDQLRALLDRTGSGPGAQFQLMAGELGLQTQGLGELQAARAMIDRLVPAQRPPGSGTMSDRDLELYKSSLPRIMNQPGGNQLILQSMQSILEHDLQAASIAQQALNGTISREAASAQMLALGDPLASVRGYMGGGGGVSQPTGAQTGGISDDELLMRYSGGN